MKHLYLALFLCLSTSFTASAQFNRIVSNIWIIEKINDNGVITNYNSNMNEGAGSINAFSGNVLDGEYCFRFSAPVSNTTDTTFSFSEPFARSGMACKDTSEQIKNELFINAFVDATRN